MHLDGVSITFGGIRALNAVTMDVRDQEILGLIGPNGSGKTTLLNCILGYYAIESGEITFRGRRLTRELPHSRVAMGMGRSFQHIDMFDRLTVEEVVLLGMHPAVRESFLGALFTTPGHRRNVRRYRQRAFELVKALGLDHLRDLHMSELPYGARKMVDVARAVAADPVLVLLDEPSSGVSLDEREEIAHLLRSIHARGTTLLLIEHNMSIVEALATRVVALNYGVKVIEGSFEQVIAEPTLQEAYFGRRDPLTQP
jgi:branched-chain amino acid transport system ATP-binding protein